LGKVSREDGGLLKADPQISKVANPASGKAAIGLAADHWTDGGAYLELPMYLPVPPGAICRERTYGGLTRCCLSI
jgi:hypothetical protein